MLASHLTTFLDWLCHACSKWPYYLLDTWRQSWTTFSANPGTSTCDKEESMWGRLTSEGCHGLLLVLAHWFYAELNDCTLALVAFAHADEAINGFEQWKCQLISKTLHTWVKLKHLALQLWAQSSHFASNQGLQKFTCSLRRCLWWAPFWVPFRFHVFSQRPTLSLLPFLPAHLSSLNTSMCSCPSSIGKRKWRLQERFCFWLTAQ